MAFLVKLVWLRLQILIDWLILFYFILYTNTGNIQARVSMWQKRKSQVEKTTAYVKPITSITYDAVLGGYILYTSVVVRIGSRQFKCVSL